MVTHRLNHRRVRLLKAGLSRQGAVAYWMSRDQRASDNWALCFAQELALAKRAPLVVVFALAPKFLDATLRQYDFLLKGLAGTRRALEEKNINFFFLPGEPGQEIPRFIRRYDISALVADFDPLRLKRRWKEKAADAVSVPFYEVDTHNIVPCWLASPKQEFAASTFRPKIHRHLAEFLEAMPALKRHPFSFKERNPAFGALKILSAMGIDRSVGTVHWLEPGEAAAHKALKIFLKERLSRYAQERNDPLLETTSGLSPYLHFGQIAAQRVALEVLKSPVGLKRKEAFLEELIVRRELSDNFCFYNSWYDKTEGFPRWARETLRLHAKDRRQYVYSRQIFEEGKTHDPLWNAAQIQMVMTGKMHGYMRMYWAKKIYEWSPDVISALKTAIHLNDKYELDGRDSNGYTGIAWSIGGVHDRAWGERAIFGKVRFMSDGGCRSKFDADGYIEKIKKLLPKEF